MLGKRTWIINAYSYLQKNKKHMYNMRKRRHVKVGLGYLGFSALHKV